MRQVYGQEIFCESMKIFVLGLGKFVSNNMNSITNGTFQVTNISHPSRHWDESMIPTFPSPVGCWFVGFPGHFFNHLLGW